MTLYNALVSEDGKHIISIHSTGIAPELLIPGRSYTKDELLCFVPDSNSTYKLCDYVTAMNARGGLSPVELLKIQKPPRAINYT